MRYSKKNIILTITFALIGSFLIYILLKDIGSYLEFIHKHFQIRRWILSFGKWDFMAFITLQILQVIFMFIPGEVIQASGGYIFGTFLGTVFALCGILVGSIATFIIGRALGERLLRRILPKKELANIKELINRPKNKVILTVLYLVPGIPKDILGYASGITSLKVKEFAIISTVSRIPGTLASTYLGARLYHENYLILSIGVVLALIIIIVGISQKDRILDYLNS